MSWKSYVLREPNQSVSKEVVFPTIPPYKLGPYDRKMGEKEVLSTVSLALSLFGSVLDTVHTR